MIETTSLITRKKLRDGLNSVFEELYHSEFPFQIEVKPSEKTFKYLDHTNYLELPGSDWFPDFLQMRLFYLKI